MIVLCVSRMDQQQIIQARDVTTKIPINQSVSKDKFAQHLLQDVDGGA